MNSFTQADLMARLKTLEERIRYLEPPDEQNPEFVTLPGKIPILLSAPHGAAHTRNGEIKEEDEFTAAIVQFLAEQTGAYAIFSQRKSNTDPNRDNNVPYKDAIVKIICNNTIRFVMDIHGAAASREFGIALGTMDRESCPDHVEKIIQVFQENGFNLDASKLDRLAVDIKDYKAKGQGTVTRFVTELGVPGAQFEINAHLRIVERRLDVSTIKTSFEGEPEYIWKTIKTFIDLIEQMSKDLEDRPDEAKP